MEFLNNALRQITDLFRSMTPTGRITAGLLLAVLVVSLGFLAQGQIQSGHSYLLEGQQFDQSDINSMMKAFSQAGLKDAVIEGARIRIPAGTQYQYLAALAEHQSMPKEFGSAFEEMLKSNNWFESNELRRLKLQHAVQQELALIIRRMNGIETATVRFDEASSGGFPARKEKRAMVALKAEGSRALNETVIQSVRDMVVQSFAGLDPENVTVTDLYSNRAYTGKNFASGEHKLFATKQRFEDDWQRRIYEVLAMYPGIVVGVNVELDPTLHQSTNKTQYDPQATTVTSSSSNRNSTSRGASTGGRPGAVPNGVGPGEPKALLSSSAPESTDEETLEQRQSVVGQETIHSQTHSLVPKAVTATVGVPRSYYLMVWKQRNPAADGETAKTPAEEELQSIKTTVNATIEEMVVQMLPPKAPGFDKYTNVKVKEFDDLPTAAPVEPGVAEQSAAWLATNWQTLALFGLGAFCLIVVRGMVRSAQAAAETPDPTSAALPAVQLATSLDETVEEDDEERESMLRRFSSTGPSLQEELTSMVKESPDAAANVLRAWIGEAA